MLRQDGFFVRCRVSCLRALVPPHSVSTVGLATKKRSFFQEPLWWARTEVWRLQFRWVCQRKNSLVAHLWHQRSLDRWPSTTIGHHPP